MNEEEKEIQLLLEKSQEAFVLALELYNKPTIKYRVEGFSFFICNAWELMLKAKIIRDYGIAKIYYPDKPNRTISLEECIKKYVFTNINDPLRQNLEKIIDLRNTSTHYITTEYEMLYIPLFQSCTYNYVDKLLQFHNINITDKIPMHFLNLSVSDSFIDEDMVKAKYSQDIYNKLIKTGHMLEESTNNIRNEKYSIVIKQDLYLTKKTESGIPRFRIIKGGEKEDEKVKIIKQISDPNNVYPLTVQKVVIRVNDILEKLKLDIRFTKNNFNDFNKYFDFKGNKEFCYKHDVYKNPIYAYSQKVIDFIIDQIKKDNTICSNIRTKLRERK